MRIWRKALERGCKFLVIRRDGTIPFWDWFVLGQRDPAATAALRAYAAKARELGMAEDYCASVEELAGEWDAEIEALGKGNPDQGPHRKDVPNIIDLMDGDVGMKRTIMVRREKA